MSLLQIKHAVETALRGQTFEADAQAEGAGRVRDQCLHQLSLRHRLCAAVDAIVFAVIHCGYTVRCALEAEETGATRIDRIYRLIDECQFGVHNILRIEHDPINALPRFNMPFELGVFLDARHFGEAPQRDKRCLVLEAERYRYQKYLSDIAGQDIRQQDNAPTKAVDAVRASLAAARPRSARPLPGATAITRHFSEFQANLPAMPHAAALEPTELGFFDRANLMAQFLSTRTAGLFSRRATANHTSASFRCARRNSINQQQRETALWYRSD